MGDHIEVKDVQAENCGAIIQIDTSAGRIFVETRDILRALNNSIYRTWDGIQVAQYGATRIDPSAPPWGYLTNADNPAQEKETPPSESTPN